MLLLSEDFMVSERKGVDIAECPVALDKVPDAKDVAYRQESHLLSTAQQINHALIRFQAPSILGHGYCFHMQNETQVKLNIQEQGNTKCSI